MAENNNSSTPTPSVTVNKVQAGNFKVNYKRLKLDNLREIALEKGLIEDDKSKNLRKKDLIEMLQSQ